MYNDVCNCKTDIIANGGTIINTYNVHKSWTGMFDKNNKNR